MQLLVALDLDHRQRADPEGLKSRLLDRNSPDAIRKGDEIAVETIKSRSYPRSSSTIGICKKITRCGYASSIAIETVLMGTTIIIQYKVYSPLVRSIKILKRAESNDGTEGNQDATEENAESAK
jgi:ribosomal protein L19